MPAPSFVQLTPDLAQALEDGLVLTPNERLKRQLELAYDAQQALDGRRVWPSARVLSVESWLRTLHGRASLDDPDTPELLSAEQLLLLTRMLAPEGLRHLAGLALDGWETLWQWRVPLDSSSLGATENGRLLRQWLTRLRDQLSGSNAISAVQLPELSSLRAQVREQSLSCYGFENPPPRVTGWLSALEDNGIRVRSLAAPAASKAKTEQAKTERAKTERIAFDSPERELAAVARWCRQLLENAGAEPPRIGVVVPDLNARHGAVQRQFQAEFDPAASTGTALAFDIAGGEPLAGQPCWRDAERWLRLCFAELPTTQARALFRSRYLELPTLVPWPEDLPELVSGKALADLSGSPALQSLLPEAPQPRTLSAWGQEFLRLLRRVGWTGTRSGSVQYQAREQLERVLSTLAGSSIEGVLRAPEALLELRGALERSVFAPQRPPAPVQVLGYLETTGLSFTHLWITGMDEDAWPAPVRSNPFLPLKLRKEFAIARSTPSQELAFASERLDHWLHAAERVTFSYTRYLGDAPLAPSPLLLVFPEVAPTALAAARPHPYFLANPQLESIEDAVASPRAPGASRGGTALLRDQASCPFRAWAIHRLGLRESRAAHAFPDPLDRGMLAHAVLQQLYEPLIGQELEESTLADLAAQVPAAIRECLRRSYGRFPEPFLEREAERLERLLRAWLQLDSYRAPFRLLEVEKQRELAIDELIIRVRLDRVDEVAGRRFVIDYKTGQTRRPPADGTLDDPQLPLYALCDAASGGVAFARLDEDRPALVAIADEALGVRGATVPADGWEPLRERWHTQLVALAREVQSGYAAVAPRRPDSCARCHLADFCRIRLIEEARS